MNTFDLLEQGILLEDSNELLQWGTGMEDLLQKHDTVLITMPDRTVLHWQKKNILNGFNCNLEVCFWNESDNFTSIESIFNKVPTTVFASLIMHLLENLGTPTEKFEHDDLDKHWIWKRKTVTITVSLFEMQGLRCVLKIERN